MDEPLSNLDAKLRVQMRGEIASLQERLGITSVYVTHDQVEAMTMGDRVAVLHEGHLMQCATPRELYDRPLNTFVAGFIGSPAMNLCTVPLEGGSAAPRPGPDSARPGGRRERRWAGRGHRGHPAGIARAGRRGAPRTGRSGRGARLRRLRGLHRRAGGRPTKLTVRVDPWRAPGRGDRLSLMPRNGEMHAFHPESGRRLGAPEADGEPQ